MCEQIFPDLWVFSPQTYRHQGDSKCWLIVWRDLLFTFPLWINKSKLFFLRFETKKNSFKNHNFVWHGRSKVIILLGGMFILSKIEKFLGISRLINTFSLLKNINATSMQNILFKKQPIRVTYIASCKNHFICELPFLKTLLQKAKIQKSKKILIAYQNRTEGNSTKNISPISGRNFKRTF